MTTWLVAAGAVMVVAVLYWMMSDYVLDNFGPRPGNRPRDGSPA